MHPEIGRAAFVIACFLIAGSLISLRIVAAGSAEAVISVITLGLGILLIALVGLFARISR